MVTLAGERGLLLVGEPGTAKSMLSELLAAAVCGTSALTVQGTAGTTEDQLRYGWNYALLLAQGPSPAGAGALAGAHRDARRRGRPGRGDHPLPARGAGRAGVDPVRPAASPCPSSPGTDGATVHAAPGFTVIATANLRDRGVSEMSAALKRRFNFETVGPIADLDAETALVAPAGHARRVERVGAPFAVDDAVLEALVTAFRDLRAGRSVEGWEVERPSTVMSTAEAVAVADVARAGRRLLPRRPGRAVAAARAPARRRAQGRPGRRARGCSATGTARCAAAPRTAARLWRRLWDLRDVLAD